MNLEYFIAKRIASSGRRTISKFIIRIAITAVSLSMAVMIIATGTVVGFQKEISEKIFGFWGHIHIKTFESNRSYETLPINKKQNFYPHLDTLPGIRHIQVYATKAGIIRTDTDMEGIVLKGIDRDYDWKFLEKYITEGRPFFINDTAVSNSILISAKTASRLSLKTGDDVVVYFIQQPPRARKFQISGIYNTGLEEYDKIYALVDIGHIQKLNDWSKDQVGGFEVFIDNVNDIEEKGELIHYSILDGSLYAQTMKEINPNIFDWLELQDMNKNVILFLMVLVASINMITVLLILILERTNMIGLLKAMGATNFSIQKIFLYNSAYIIGIGLLWGNLIGAGIALLQEHFQIIKLPEESYYVSVAPIDLDIVSLLLINAGTLVICLLILLIPSYLVTRINPIKAIRFN